MWERAGECEGEAGEKTVGEGEERGEGRKGSGGHGRLSSSHGDPSSAGRRPVMSL